jgi:hypothetical protein
MSLDSSTLFILEIKQPNSKIKNKNIDTQT